MRHLLDTHTFLWMAALPENLSAKVQKIVLKRESDLYLSAASGWEIALLQNLGRIQLPDAAERFVPSAMQELSVTPLPIGFATAISAASLPLIHRDPFDRILVAEAMREKLVLVTKDTILEQYDVETLW